MSIQLVSQKYIEDQKPEESDDSFGIA